MTVKKKVDNQYKKPVVEITKATVQVKDKKVDVITSRGDKHLGGEDFDQELIKIIDKKYKKAKGKGLDVKDSKLAQTAEKIKKILSSKEKVTEIIEGPKGPHKIEIKREEFEESIDTYLEKIKMLMEEALEGAKCKPSNISQSLLVGGSSRIPIVSKIITKIMKKPGGMKDLFGNEIWVPPGGITNRT